MPEKSESDGYNAFLQKAKKLEEDIYSTRNPCRLFKYEKELSDVLHTYTNMCIFFELQSKVRDVKGSNAKSAIKLKWVTAAIDRCVHALKKQYVITFDKLIGLAESGALEKLLLASANEYIRKSGEDEKYGLISDEEREIEDHELDWAWGRYKDILEERGEKVTESEFDLIKTINLGVFCKIKEKILGIAPKSSSNN